MRTNKNAISGAIKWSLLLGFLFLPFGTTVSSVGRGVWASPPKREPPSRLADDAQRWVLRTLLLGEKAPEFSLRSITGKEVKLRQYRGKYVVLEWVNFDCPFVTKHYKGKNIQKLQEKFGKKGVVWLSVLSAAKGKKGYKSPTQLNRLLTRYKAHPTAVLYDPEGKVARLYKARTTPHMFVLNPKGEIIYNGSLDSTHSTQVADVKKAKNYVSMALQQAMNRKQVRVSFTIPYGCTIPSEKG